MSALTMHSSISCLACSLAMPRNAWPRTSGICWAGTFMGALLGLVRVGAASVAQAGRPPLTATRSCLPPALVPAYPAAAVSSLWLCGRSSRRFGVGTSFFRCGRLRGGSHAVSFVQIQLVVQPGCP
jgi:hypothetical protein